MLSREWKKSTRSAAQTDCVELRQHADTIQVRDSKLGDASPILDLDTATYTALLAELKRH
ncbi:DUF397 domain-containing protein [Glycomyces salinus]|uniref:DUF397 domain-containing protein n=1 Tax=Glycomyces salinus TaxID=980294 RepID=UPI001E4474B8|nr:DUF397 domain-containing protein [Glycomyces salinus]